jgi:hypothetical protein
MFFCSVLHALLGKVPSLLPAEGRHVRNVKTTIFPTVKKVCTVVVYYKNVDPDRSHFNVPFRSKVVQ